MFGSAFLLLGGGNVWRCIPLVFCLLTHVHRRWCRYWTLSSSLIVFYWCETDLEFWPTFICWDFISPVCAVFGKDSCSQYLYIPAWHDMSIRYDFVALWPALFTCFELCVHWYNWWGWCPLCFHPIFVCCQVGHTSVTAFCIGSWINRWHLRWHIWFVDLLALRCTGRIWCQVWHSWGGCGWHATSRMSVLYKWLYLFLYFVRV